MNSFAAETSETSERHISSFVERFQGSCIAKWRAVASKKVSPEPSDGLLTSLRQSSCLLLVAAIITACATQPLNPPTDDQPWLKSLIASIEQEPVWNPPATITRYTYRGAPVYYLAPHCCDIRSKLYDANGAMICEPDGGITGKGDGKCEDFLAARAEEHLIWRDSRGK
jgi:hypothetical protein